jgi:DNA-binding HxlR family transcriptional regulator
LAGRLEAGEPGPRVANVVTHVASKLAQVDRSRFEWLGAEVPNFATTVMNILVERLRKMTELGVDYH